MNTELKIILLTVDPMKDNLGVDQMELFYPIRIHFFPDKYSNQIISGSLAVFVLSPQIVGDVIEVFPHFTSSESDRGDKSSVRWSLPNKGQQT